MFNLLRPLLAGVRAFLNALAGAGITPTLAISAVRPAAGWPGTLVTLDGIGFGEALDDNIVQIGGVQALVVRASANQLTVLVGEAATSGAIHVSKGSVTATAPQSFQLLPWPELRDAASSGPPVFFHGPQHGTPALHKKNQPVLAVFAQGAGSPPVNQAAEIAAEMATFKDAERFWREASYETGPASHGTSFTIEQGPWVHLPQSRNAYVWDDDDVAWARGELFAKTKRWTMVIGAHAHCAHQGGGLSIADVAGANWPSEVSKVGPWIAYHVAVSGSTAFVAAGPAGLVAVAIGGVPGIVGTLALGGNLRGCDISGNILVAAAMHGGLEIYDVTNPAMMVRRAAIDGGADWATCVKRVGNRAFVGAGKLLRIYDVSNPSAPNRVGQAATADWVLGLDVAGNTCVVATNGGGLGIFDVSGATPVPRGQLKDALHVFNVRLAGTTAYAACGADGLLIADVSNPTAPKKLSLTPTGRACYDVTPPFLGSAAVVSVGASGVVAADFSDPAHPALGIPNQLSSTPPLGGDYDLAALRATLINAGNSHGTTKGFRLHVDALLGAKAAMPGLNLDAFDGFIIVIQGMPGRGQSGLRSEVIWQSTTLKFNETKGVIWLPSHTSPGTRTTWGRKAHELGHWFGMKDIYEDAFEDGTVKNGDAEQWDLAGKHDLGPLFSGHEADRIQLFDAANVVRRRWLPSIPPGTEEFEIVAHGANEDTTGRIHLLQLQVTDWMSYYVEVRQKPGTVIFDSQIPVGAGASGRVLVTRVDEQQSISNTFEQPTMLFGVLHTGDSVVDAARLLRIEAGAVIQANPLTYKIIVHWNELPNENPDGKYDLRIEPWSTDTWQTPDIWVNSTRNDKGGAPIFEWHEPGDETRPILNGDKPWVKRPNTIFARVTNSGGEEAKNVFVTCYVNSPPGIGDNGSWDTLKTETIASIPAASAHVVQFEWKPALDKHTCISVAIYPQQGERTPKNNRAQENVANFDSAGSSSHEPAVLEAVVRSPFSVWRRVELRVRGLPGGWHAVVDKAWVWLPPKGTAPVTAVIWTDLHSPRARHELIPPVAHARVEGWTDYAEHLYLPIGGILAAVKANARTRIVFEVRVTPSRLFVLAWLQPPAAGVPGVVEITDAAGASQYLPLTSNASGELMTDLRIAPGRYDVQVFTSSTLAAAEAESERRHVEVPA